MNSAHSSCPLARFRLLPGLLVFTMVLGLFAAERPNILWVTSEDNGPHLGCYGDDYATTPNLDKLASKSLVYKTCWSTAPVCAAARTTIIAGMYPTSLGAQHMRSTTHLPEGLLMYPQYLRQLGYHVHNKGKEDYNLHKPKDPTFPGTPVWDKNDYSKRDQDKPFFQIFNYTISHESKLRTRPHKQVHDPAGVRIPKHHPDTPEFRQDWAQYYDRLTEMDKMVGDALDQLEKSGEADDTIIFYYGDHGSGMPRHKRWPFNSGLHVPLIVHVPEKWKHLRPEDYTPGGTTERVVGFVDLAPTLISLAGSEPPKHMHGKAFLGPHATPEPDYIFGFRGRMDERIELVRSVRDKQFIYMRHFMPHREYGQHVQYMFQTPSTAKWHALHEAGKLTPETDRFWQTKPAEELYDLHADPDEVINLAGNPAHAETLKKMREALIDWQTETGDLLMAEHDLHARAADSTPWDMAQKLPLDEIQNMARLASGMRSDATPTLVEGLSHTEPVVRYWAALGFHMRGQLAVREHAELLRKALEDEWPTVRLAAAEGLAHHGEEADRDAAVRVLLDSADAPEDGNYVTMLALMIIDDLDDVMKPHVEEIRGLGKEDKTAPSRTRKYNQRLHDKLAVDLGYGK